MLRPVEYSYLSKIPFIRKCVFLFFSAGALFESLNFGLKTGIDFALVGLISGVVFAGTTGAYERIYRFSPK